MDRADKNASSAETLHLVWLGRVEDMMYHMSSSVGGTIGVFKRPSDDLKRQLP